MKIHPSVSLATIASMIGAEYTGDPAFQITGLNEIHMVQPGDITFVDHPKYYSKALNSKATTIIINTPVDCPEGKALLLHEDPFAAFNLLIRKFRPFTPSATAISPTASIGEGTIIQPNTFVGNYVVIGKNCIIHSNVSIYDHAVIGNNVIINSGSVIGGDAYYFQRKPEGYRKFHTCGRVVIEDDVEIGALCAIDSGVSGDTVIGRGTKFDNHVQVGHDTTIGRNCLIGSHCAIAGVTRIEDDVILWGKVAINKDIVIGKGAVLLATSAVDKSLEGGKVYFGIPADEARKKWKELASLRRLPALLSKLDAMAESPDKNPAPDV
ncbi:MAG: UDP-3-O-(3-hydroxymyristoyl)glucosamine N-acyltransferase [Lentimicrobium sp.]|nr:UDP-3-O-(3-hydroxymyristoyl)glucosamine N-acyltransferase [Lentimicrobium sp.]MDD2526642.1 UDP-3-O-(3-hydroxymyristoyl)glucosamine N-acyltransferase [Lentimicrobiaceae bacterium]MDD4596826.1 UDP-3-O-(3-hydroxymyristoyl)glucosamine N-acyltransferase [Lentimicrobiaceae bacterium]MDY0025315.1 UDP-3-O-(3-hydroxymyristoyl)glucosamine N-acyltransferase [Lentimicrobium sp.]HAH60347.1 UDP-3-O-(3-hydroxymyristoyl)glucosamine N-acyltransferase [Bacteroidales bacterium]